MCHCGHRQDSHHESKYTCLGMLCDCASYRDRELPLPKATKPAPMFTPDDEEPETPRIGAGTSHPTWCTCSVCMLGFGGP